MSSLPRWLDDWDSHLLATTQKTPLNPIETHLVEYNGAA